MIDIDLVIYFHVVYRFRIGVAVYIHFNSLI